MENRRSRGIGGTIWHVRGLLSRTKVLRNCGKGMRHTSTRTTDFLSSKSVTTSKVGSPRKRGTGFIRMFQVLRWRHASSLRRLSTLRQEGEGDGAEEAGEGGEVVPFEALAQVEQREPGEDAQGDDLLQDLELRGRVGAVPPAVGRHHEHILEKTQCPNCPGPPARAAR